jgi:hypothetical protein
VVAKGVEKRRSLSLLSGIMNEYPLLRAIVATSTKSVDCTVKKVGCLAFSRYLLLRG